MEELKALLEHNFILKEDDRELFYLIKDNYRQFKSFVTEKLGYDLLIRGDFIRLEKLPGKAESWMGTPGFEEQREYVFLMILFIFLEDKNKEDQFLLSHLTEFIASNSIGEAVDFTQYKVRRSLIKVIKFAVAEKLMHITDGEEDGFMQDGSKEVLFESTGLSKYMVRNFQTDVVKFKSYKDLEELQEDFLEADRGILRKNRVYRRLLLSPIVYREASNDEDYAYIKNYRNIIEEDFKKYLGWHFHLHRNGALVFPDEKDKVSYGFPVNSGISDVLLHVNTFIGRKLKEGHLNRALEDTIFVSEETFKLLLKEVKEQMSYGWSKEYREMGEDKLFEEVVGKMTYFRMLNREKDKLVILPLAGKIAGDYEESFKGGGQDE